MNIKYVMLANPAELLAAKNNPSGILADNLAEQIRDALSRDRNIMALELRHPDPKVYGPYTIRITARPILPQDARGIVADILEQILTA